MSHPVAIIGRMLSTYRFSGVSTFVRVAMVQGKLGIWLLTFPDRENTGNLVNLIFYTGKILKI